MSEYKPLPTAEAIVDFVNEHNVTPTQWTYLEKDDAHAYACAAGMVAMMAGMDCACSPQDIADNTDYSLQDLRQLEKGFMHGLRDTDAHRIGDDVAKALNVAQWP